MILKTCLKMKVIKKGKKNEIKRKNEHGNKKKTKKNERKERK